MKGFFETEKSIMTCCLLSVQLPKKKHNISPCNMEIARTKNSIIGKFQRSYKITKIQNKKIKNKKKGKKI